MVGVLCRIVGMSQEKMFPYDDIKLDKASSVSVSKEN